MGSRAALVERLADGATASAARDPAAGDRRHALRGDRRRRPRPPRCPVLVPPGAEADFLAPLPSGLLTPDPDVRARLTRFGLRRIGAVAELPRSALVARFGDEGARLHARARGEELEPFRPRRAPERLALALPIEPPVARPGAAPLRPPSTGRALAAQLERAGSGGRAGDAARLISISPSRPPGTPPDLAVEQRFPEPTADAEAIERLLFARLEQDPAAGRRRAARPGAGGHDPGRRPATAVVRAAGRADRPARLAARPAGPDVRRGPRPARRRHRSRGATARESLDVAGVGEERSVTRLLREHPPIDVELDADGRLVAIRWNGRREPVEVCNRWRVEEAWWREPIARDYCQGRRGRAGWRSSTSIVDGSVASRAALRLGAATGHQPNGRPEHQGHDEEEGRKARHDDARARTRSSAWIADARQSPQESRIGSRPSAPQ